MLQLIDDETASRYYNEIDTATGDDLQTKMSALESWATDKKAKQHRQEWDQVSGVFTDFDNYSASEGLNDLDEESRYQYANRQFIAHQTGGKFEDQMFVYPSKRDEVTDQMFGKTGVSEKEAFNLFKGAVESRKASEEALRELPGVLAQGVLKSAGEGKQFDEVDSWFAFDGWKQRHADKLGAMPAGWETAMLDSAVKLHARTEALMADVAPESKRAMDTLMKFTRPEDAESLPDADRSDVENLAKDFAKLTPEQRDGIYATLSYAAEAGGAGLGKGFWEKVGEGVARGGVNIYDDAAMTAEDRQARQNISFFQDLLDKPQAEPDRMQTAESIQMQRDMAQDGLDKNKQRLGELRVMREIRDLAQGRIDPIKTEMDGVLGSVVQGAYDFSQSAAYTGMAMIPYVGLPAVMGALANSNYLRMLDEYPDMDADAAYNLSLAIAGPQAVIERFQGGLLLGKLPYLNQAMKRLTDVRVPLPARLGLGYAGVVGAETVTELAQEAMPVVADQIASAVREDMPEFDAGKAWGAYREQAPKIFYSMLWGGLIGGGAVGIRELDRSGVFMRNVQELEMHGITGEAAQNIAAEQDADKATTLFREAWDKRSPEDIQAGISKRAAMLDAAQATQANPDLPTRRVEQAPDGTTTHIIEQNGQTIYSTNDPAAADLALVNFTRMVDRGRITGTTNGIVEALSFFNQVNEAANRGDDVQKFILENTPRNLLDEYEANPTEQNLDNLFKTVATIGQDISEPAELANFPVLASNQGALAEGIFKSVIRIYEGATGDKVVRDVAQDNLKRAIAEQRITMDWVRENLNQIIPQIESERISQKLRTETDTDVIESFSDVALAYMRGNIRDEQIPAGLRGFLRRMAIVVKDIFRRAYKLKRLVAEGKVDSNFESFLADSVGLNQQARVDVARERVSNEVLTDTNYSIGRSDEITGLPLNPNGTVTVYHGTTKDSAAEIQRTGILKSAGEPDVYFTTAKDGTGYGDGTVVGVEIDPKQLILDDEFPDGRRDFRVNVGKSKSLAVNLSQPTSATNYSSEEKYSQIVPEISSVNPNKVSRRDMYEVAKVSPDVAANMSFEKPIEVSLFADGTLMLSDGHHRLAAAKQLGMNSIPAVVRSINAKGNHINALIAEQQPGATNYSIGMTVAPLRRDSLSELNKKEMQKRASSAKFIHLQQVIDDVAKAYGVKIESRQPVIGGWVEGGQISLEVPEAILFDTDDLDIAQEMAAIVGASAPELQNAVMLWKDDDAGKDTVLEFQAKGADSALAVAKDLNAAGLNGFTYDTKSRKFSLVLTGAEADTINKVNDFITRHTEQGSISSRSGYQTRSGEAAFPSESDYRRNIENARSRAGLLQQGQREALLDVVDRAERRVDRYASALKISEQAKKIQKKLKRPSTSALAIETELKGKQFDNIRQLGLYLDARFNKVFGKPSFEINGQEGIDIASDAFVYDIIDGLAGDGSGMGWYDERVQETIRELSKLHPEFATDSNALAVYIGILATTSQGYTVVENFKQANKVYNEYKRTGRIPTDFKFAKSSDPINSNLAQIQGLIDEHGLDGYAEFMDQEVTGQALRDQFGKTPTGVTLKDTVRGNRVLGPKIGSFFNNLRGQFDTITMDLWYTRTMHRFLGETVVPLDSEKMQKAITKFREELKKDGVRTYGIDLTEALKDDEATVQAALTLFQRWARGDNDYTEKGYFKFPDGYKIEKAARGIFSIGGMKGAPQNKTHRQYFAKVVLEAKAKLAKLGMKLTEADMQAIIWYREKNLFARTGVANAAAKPADYLDAVMVARSGAQAQEDVDPADLEAEDGDTNYSIASQSEIDRVNRALGGMNRGPDARIAVYERAKSKFSTLIQNNQQALDNLRAGTVSFRRTQLLQALGELDAILSIFPPDIRGRVGGYTRLASIAPHDVFKDGEKISEVSGMNGAIISAWMREGLSIGPAGQQTELPPGYTAKENLGTARADRAIADFFKKRIEMIDRELEKTLRREYDNAFRKLLDRTKPKKAKPGEKPKGIGGDIQDLFAVVRDSVDMSATDVAAHIAGLDSKIASGELTAEQEARAMVEAALVALTGDWKNADADRRRTALMEASRIWNGAYAQHAQKVIRQREERELARFDAIAATGKAGDLAGRKSKAIADSGLKGSWKDYILNLLNFDQVVGVLFGENTEVANTIIDKQRQAENAKEDGSQAKMQELEDFFTGLAGGNLLDGERLRYRLTQPSMTVNEIEMSELEALSAAMMWAQEDGRRHMEGEMDEIGKPSGAWHYDQAFVDEILANLSTEALALRDWLGQRYAEEYGNINAVYSELNGVNLPQIRNYSPVTVQPVNAPTGQVLDPVSGSAMSGASTSPGALRTRGTAIAEPRFQDVLQTYISHTLQMEHWKAFAPMIAEANGILRNRDVQNSVEEKGGAEARKMLNAWLDYFAQGGTRDAGAHLALNQGLNNVLGRASQVALVGRASTLLIQSTQLGAAIAEMPVKAYLKRMGKLLTGQLGWDAALNSDYIQRRVKQMPPVVQMAMQGLKGAKPTAIQQAGKRLGMLLSGADGLFTAGTYAITYDYHLSKAKELGLAGQEAEDYARNTAERVTDRIAQPTRAGARSLYENTSTNPLARAGWAFASEARKNLAITAYSFAERDTATKLRTLAYVVALNSIGASILRSIWRDIMDDEDDDLFDDKYWSPKRIAIAMATEPLYGFPALGSVVQGGVNKAFGEYKPSGSLFSVDRAIGPIKRLPDHLSGDTDLREVMRDIDMVISALGIMHPNIAATASITHLAKDLFNLTDSTVDAVTEE